MKLEDIKNYLEENKEDEQVASYLEELSTPTVDGVKGFLESNEEGQKLLQSLSDARVTQGIESFKSNNLEKLIDEEMRKRNPELSDEQIELQQIKQKLEQIEYEKQYEVLKNKALTIATEKKIPTNMVDYLIGEDEEATEANLTTFEQTMKDYVDSQVKARINDSSYTPPAEGSGNKTFTTEQVNNMTAQEINENWEVVKDIIGK